MIAQPLPWDNAAVAQLLLAIALSRKIQQRVPALERSVEEIKIQWSLP